MEVTILTWIVAIAGLALISFPGSLQLVALIRPRSQWTIDNVYGGKPDRTVIKAYLAFNQGFAWADSVSWHSRRSAGASECSLGNVGDSYLLWARRFRSCIPPSVSTFGIVIWGLVRAISFTGCSPGVYGRYLVSWRVSTVSLGV